MFDCDFFWWLGALHADGYVYTRKNRFQELRLRVSACSLPMLLKWKRILDELTGKEHKILVEQMYDSRYDRHFEQYLIREGSVKTLEKLALLFTSFGVQLGKLAVPTSALENSVLGGGYLAGLIDGDGCVQIRRSSDGKRTERLIKIASNDKRHLKEVQTLLASMSLPDGYISTYPNHVDLWVFVSSATAVKLNRLVVPHLAIGRKAERLK
jgi:hypothetical protein